MFCVPFVVRYQCATYPVVLAQVLSIVTPVIANHRGIYFRCSFKSLVQFGQNDRSWTMYGQCTC